MKRIKDTLSVLCLSAVMVACSSDDENGVPATNIINLSLQSNPGNIELAWDYECPEGKNTNRYVEIRYYDPAKKKEVKKTVSAFTNSYTVEETRKKYGEYKFTLQPFSTTFTPGTIQEISGVSEVGNVIDTYTSKELVMKPEDIYIEGLYTGTSADLLDKDSETYINTDYTKPLGTIFYIDIAYPKAQKFLKFSYMNRNHEAASFPAEVECYCKVNEDDDWTLVKTLEQAEDGLPTGAKASFTSKEYECPFEFNYFRFKVLKTHTGKVNFSLAEFSIYEVEHYYYNPEAE